MDAVVHAAVATVDIAPEVGGGVAVVEGGVEVAALLAAAAFYLNLAELLLPSLDGMLVDVVESLVFAGGEVLAGALAVDAGDGHVDLHLLAVIGEFDEGLHAAIVVFD